MVEEQLNLLDVSLYSNRKLRGHYKEKEKKPEKINPYAKIAQLYSQVASYLPIPIMSQGQEIFDFGLLTLWYSHYDFGLYNYQGEAFPGDDFKVIQAELKGTEDLYINERIFLHSKLLELVHKGININEAAKLLQPLILKFKSGELILEFDYAE